MNDGRNGACVLVFAGLDPSGGAGIQADIQAISAAGAHALPIVTALTVQDNQHVHAVHPVDPEVLHAQARALVDQGTRLDAIKIGIVGSAANAKVIADVITLLRATNADLPVVLDPVLASGHGDMLSKGDAVQALVSLRTLATLITPNLPEASALCSVEDIDAQARILMQYAPHVLIKGGHGDGDVAAHLVHAEHGRHLAEARPGQVNRLRFDTRESVVVPLIHRFLAFLRPCRPGLAT